MKIKTLPLNFAVLCFIGAIIAFVYSAECTAVGHHTHEFDGIRENYRLVAGFFALVSTFFLSVSFTKKA